MSIQDFSDGFSVLLNSYAIAAGFGSTDSPTSVELDEYEKSLFLTQAQEELVISLYSGRNITGASFEETEEMRRALSILVKEEDSAAPITNTNGIKLGGSRSYFFSLPSDVWYIIYEAVKIAADETIVCKRDAVLDVLPVRHDEYHKIKNNPFRGANSRRALRLDIAIDNAEVVEIICNYKIGSYMLRYLRKPYPIILETLADGMTIEGQTSPKSSTAPCELNESLHQRILELAVQRALESRYGGGRSSASGTQQK